VHGLVTVRHIVVECMFFLFRLHCIVRYHGEGNAATIDPSSWSLVLSLSLSLVGSSIYGQGACIGEGSYTISGISFVSQTNCPFLFFFGSSSLIHFTGSFLVRSRLDGCFFRMYPI
jgi:hypothetical protein